MSVMRVLTVHGDTTLEWTAKDELSTREVKEKFDEMVSAGYLAYRIDSTTTGELVREFDPKAKELLITAPLVGG